MRSLLASPRARRRAARIGFVLLAVSVALAVGWAGRGSGRDAEVRDTGTRGGGRALAQGPSIGRELPLTGERRSDVLRVASRFVATAVERKRLDEAWTLAHPDLRAGYTRERWRGGEIPVVPYPVGLARWEVQTAHEREVALYVLLEPRPGARVEPATFVLVLALHGGRWLVREWAPSGGAAYAAAPSPKPLAATSPGGAFDQGNLSPLFLLLPLAGTIGIAAGAALFVAARSWRRGRRAAVRPL